MDIRDWAYYSARSGLTPVASYTLIDHKRAFFKSQLGLNDIVAGALSISDLERKFLDPLGNRPTWSLNDLWNEYYSLVESVVASGGDGDAIDNPNRWDGGDNGWGAVAFEPTSNLIITAIEVLCTTYAANAGNISFGIAPSSALTKGSSVSSSNPTLLGETTPKPNADFVSDTWVRANFPTPINLTAGVNYDLIVKSSSGNCRYFKGVSILTMTGAGLSVFPAVAGRSYTLYTSVGGVWQDNGYNSPPFRLIGSLG